MAAGTYTAEGTKRSECIRGLVIIVLQYLLEAVKIALSKSNLASAQITQ
jgi:hypothetical protein